MVCANDRLWAAAAANAGSALAGLFVRAAAGVNSTGVHRVDREWLRAKGMVEVSEFGRGADLSSRTMIDVAIGVLVGWRGCSQREAFEELAGAVRETGVGIGSIARALVELACGTDQSAAHRAVALRLWGDVMPRRSALVSASRN